MKHKLLHPSRWGVALLLAVCTVACDTESGLPDTPPEGGDVPVGFSVGVGAPAATRASGELTTANLTSMGVFAYYTGQSSWTTANTPNFMYNQRVTRTGSSAPWTYTPVKYWPNTAGDKLSFFAYAPHTSDMTGLSIQSGTGANTAGYPRLYYDLPVDASLQKDLLAATALTNRTKSTSSAAFTMKHVLTRILVNARCSDAIRVTKVKVNSIQAGYGTLTWNSGGNPVWSSFTSVMNSEYSTATDVPANAADATQIAEYFLYPKTATGKLEITFTIGGNSETKSVDIPASPAWEMGKAIAYTLNIEVGSEVTLTVKAWDTNSANNGTMGEEPTVPSTGYPFAKNGIVYQNSTKSYYVGPDYYYDYVGDGWGQSSSGWFKWEPAIRICRGYHSASVYGKSEWRLPTIDELVIAHSLGIVGGSTYWSINDNSSMFPGCAWALSGGNRKGDMKKENGARLLCVRDMGSEMVYPTARSVNGLPVVYYSSSKSYMVHGLNEVKTQSDAISYCSGSNYGGYSNWHLPTYEEATWVLNLGLRNGTTYWTSGSGAAIAGNYQSVQGSSGGWFEDAPAGVAKARTFCVRDY